MLSCAAGRYAAQHLRCGGFAVTRRSQRARRSPLPARERRSHNINADTMAPFSDGADVGSDAMDPRSQLACQNYRACHASAGRSWVKNEPAEAGPLPFRRVAERHGGQRCSLRSCVRADDHRGRQQEGCLRSQSVRSRHIEPVIDPRYSRVANTMSQVSRTCTLGSGMVVASPLAAYTGADTLTDGQPGRPPAPCGPAVDGAGSAVTTESLLFSTMAASRGFLR